MPHNNTPAVPIRPVTSKPRGICKYYTTERGCFSGDRCKFLHSAPKPEEEREESEQPLLTPYDQTKRCKYFDRGFCKKGENCWFLHKPDKNRVVQEEEDECCSICFEKPAIYGLLGGCSHIFCLTCIKQWRDPQNKPEGVAESGNTKKCPMCRMSSKFITPSSKFWRHGTEEKTTATKAYMGSMARIQCRYFQKSLLKNRTNPICPYGKDCFYSHIKEDGTPYVFKDGVDVCMKRYGKKGRRGISLNFGPIEEILQSAFNFTINRSEPTSGTQAVSTNETPAIHRQHNSDRGGDEEGLSYAQRRRLQEAMMRSLNDTNHSASLLAMELLRVGLEITEAGLPSRSEWDVVEQGSMRGDEQGSEDERENEVMERLEMMADEMLASVGALREGMPSVNEERSHATVSSALPDDESDNEMPGLISVSSDSEEAESDEEDTDEGDTERASGESSSGSSDQFEDGPAVAAGDSSDSDSDEMPELIPIVPSESINGSGKAPSGSSLPSDAFTTDGRGRVISVGDASGVAPESSFTEEPETPASGSATNQAERRGFLEWIGSLI